ncbi:MAG: reductive dehalogenase domain-containing protein [Chloroflexota bacterium]
MLPLMGKLMLEMNKGGNFYKKQFKPTQQEATPEFIAELKQLAFEHGATAVKFTKVPEDSIFTGKAIPEPYAIVFTVKMDKEQIDTAPSFEAFLEVAKGYKRMAIISNIVSDFMRDSGYAAYPGTALGGLTDYSRIAEVAGLGAIGYHGLLITPDEGALLRINTIYTNITNLPIEEENPHTWVRDFCAKCNKCIRKCPVKAIFDQPKVQANGRVKCIDGKTCLDYFAANHGCGICIDVCPFSQVGYDVIHERFKGNPDAPFYDIPMPVAQAEPIAEVMS